ncbi:MAG: VTT domain-containing protein [Methanobacteriaceae archaeon]|nr:VTT domain-containing protein [Candidatus Methanorudis spinitermitis]
MGLWTYVILFAVVFSETGLIFLSFLPGDSLLFIIGALSANDKLDLIFIMISLSIAAILGDTVNYHIGKFIGPKIFNKKDSKFFNMKYLVETHDFYEKYGGKTIVIARLIPIIRGFMPFVAGIGTMPYKRFLFYNIIGGVLWVVIVTSAGYFFGNIPIVKDNFFIVVVAIVIISVLPVVINELRKNYNGNGETKDN